MSEKTDGKSTFRRAISVLLGIIQVSLLLAALWDIRKREDDEINGSKRVWTGIAFINYVGPVAYFLFGRA